MSYLKPGELYHIMLDNAEEELEELADLDEQIATQSFIVPAVPPLPAALLFLVGDNNEEIHILPKSRYTGPFVFLKKEKEQKLKEADLCYWFLSPHGEVGRFVFNSSRFPRFKFENYCRHVE